MLGRALGALDRAAFQPRGIPGWVVTAIALAFPVAAGIVAFGQPAALDLMIALGIGVALHLLALRLRLGISDPPAVAAVFAVAFAGPATPVAVVAALAACGGLLSLIRERLLPGLRVQTGLVAFAAVFALSNGGTAAYVNPATGRALAEPIRLWEQTGSMLVDPTRLYVGNVPGPVFATSLMAVLIGAAWAWYARRLSLMVVLAALGGAVVPVLLLHWNAGYQLDSGPTWFAVALVLADRRLLPTTNAGRPLLGFLAGLAAVGLRSRGLGVEGVAITVAALQMLVGAFEGGEWLFLHRVRVMTRLRELRRGTVRMARKRPA